MSFAALQSLPSSLLDILAAFASLTPSKYINSLSHLDLTFDEIHNYILKYILLNAHFEKYPPARQYQISFWKWIIQQLENIAKTEA